MAEWTDFLKEMVRGDDETLPFTATTTDEDGNTIPEPLTGYLELWLTAKRKPTDADADAVFIKTLTAGGVVVTGNNEMEGRLVPADTINLTNTRTHDLYAEVQGKNASGKIITMGQGRIRVRPGLTEATA